VSASRARHRSGSVLIRQNLSMDRSDVIPARRGFLPPAWPVLFLFLLYPAWWLLGLTGFIWAILAVPMLMWLYWRPSVRVPAGFGIWLLFLAWMFASLLALDDPSRLLVAAHRSSLYVSATVLLVYVYNLPEGLLSRVVGALATFWAAIVVIGLFAIVWSSLEFSSLTERLLPSGLLNSEYIVDMTSVRLAQVQDFLGFPVGRPTGPFAYTNQWGSAFVLLFPFVVLAMMIRPRPWRWLGPILGFLGVIPLVVSLDRGAWLSLAFGGVYIVFRMALRARLGIVARIVLLVALMVAVVLATPLGGLFQDRIATGHSNEGRLNIYGQVIDGVKEQPLFGYGGPREAVGKYLPQLGTHGALWLVLYSHGVPGAALFVGFFLLVLWRSRRARDPIAFGSHVVIVIGLVQMPYYGMLPAGIHILMVATALSLRSEERSPALPREGVPQLASRPLLAERT
jgi:polysaccharide biosynthesis protein PslJ